MNQPRLFTHDDPRHREAMQLLPWYVNGTLDAAEFAWVDAHVHDCVACRRECDQQRALAATVRLDVTPFAMVRGFDRLAARIDELQSPAVPLSGWRTWLRPSILLPLAAMQFVVIAALVLSGRPDPEPQYRTLSDSPATALSPDAVVVIFDPAMTLQRIHDLLRASQARIVNGPNARGAYTLEPPAGQQAATLERLRANPGVRFAQPAPGTDGMHL